jgi:hypothetical protein
MRADNFLGPPYHPPSFISDLTFSSVWMFVADLRRGNQVRSAASSN